MPLLRRRPLLRAAAVAGGAYAAGKHRGAGQAEQQAYQAAPPPAAAPVSRGTSPDDITRLEQLGKLHEQGILTDQEFAAQKAQILGTA
jgi:predicted flap endonuclease-1-like 5' DNA nuclease